MNRSEDIKDLAEALAKAQMAMEGARKDKTNPHFKSAYADMASVWEAVRDPLAAAGLAIMQWPRVVEGGVEVETILTHSTGQFISDILAMPVAGTMTAHTIGSAITYARRYALMAVAGVAPVDDDANGAVAGSAPGMAGGGTQFRPERRTGWAKDAENDGTLDTTRAKGTLASTAAKPKVSAIEHMEFIKAGQKVIAGAKTKPELSDWWRQNAEAREGAETALPAEYDKLIIAFDAKMDIVAKAVG